MKFILITLMLVLANSAIASTQSPYSGEEAKEIKSLSDREIFDLLQGNGMGFAKAAELNQFPGPRHVLDLARKLNLSNRQINQIDLIFKKMRKQAINIGTQLVRYERDLELLFSTDQISAANMDELLLKIGETRALLRGVHLHAHLETKEVLSRHQVMMYDKFRGYSTEEQDHHHSH